jgi:hypothetical protein
VTPEDFLNALECAVTQTDFEEIKKKLNSEKSQTVTSLEKNSDNSKVNFIQEENCDEATENCLAKRIPNPSDITSTIEKVKTFLTEQNADTNPKVKIILNGYAGIALVVSGLDPKIVSKGYADTVKSKIESGISGLDANLIKNVSYETKGNDGTEDESYRVDVLMETDVSKSSEVEPKKQVKKSATGTLSPEEIQFVDNLIIDEGAYFDFIDGRPSIYDTKRNVNGDEVGVQPQNLSFGRPPICILRIGDFFYTKIAIQSLSISYDGPQFDLNPEGIGVQPMIASVQMSIDLIGGHTLSGPINRLQNALSFNYYANTEMYDVRSDYVSNDGELIDGLKLGEIKRQLAAQKEESLKEDVELDQLTENEGTGGLDNSNDGDSLIEIGAKTDSVFATIKSGELPNTIKVGKNEPNEQNSLVFEVSISPSERKSPDDNVVTQEVSLDSFPKLAKSSEIKSLKTIISEKESELDSAKNTMNLTPNVPNQRKVEEAQLALDTANANLNQYLKDFKTKIKTVAYLKENKRTTKVTKDFTVTENGIN